MAKSWTCPNCKATLTQTVFLKVGKNTLNTWEQINSPKNYVELAAGTYKGRTGRA